MSPASKAITSLLAASAFALTGTPVFAQGYDLEEEESAAEETTSETVGGEIPNAAVWAGLGLLGVAAIVVGSDSDDSDGPTATVP